MKLAACALASVVAVTAAYAAGPIEWAKDVKLSLQDFKQKVPAASTDTAHSWVGLDVSWECREGRSESHAHAIFDPQQSWWRGSVPSLWGGLDESSMSRSQLENRRTSAERDQDLLRHEQLHFDLTELVARKIRKQFEALPRICATPGATDAVEKAIAAIEREWHDEQARYDRETDHGAGQVKQRQWELRVREALE